MQLIKDRIATHDYSLPIDDEESSDSDDSIDSDDSAIYYEDDYGSDEGTVSSHESNDERDNESRVSDNDLQEEDNEEDF